MEKILIYPDVTRQWDCFSGLHQGRATDNARFVAAKTYGLYCSQEASIERVPTRARVVGVTFIVAATVINASFHQDMSTRRFTDVMNDAGRIGPETARSH